MQCTHYLLVLETICVSNNSQINNCDIGFCVSNERKSHLFRIYNQICPKEISLNDTHTHIHLSKRIELNE